MSYSFQSTFNNNNNTSSDLFNNSKLNLDMSFNRNPQAGRFACDIDPLSQDLSPISIPTPTFEEFEPTSDELFDALSEWNFPIRTDYARGLIWGPYKHSRGNSWSSELDNTLLETNQPFIEPSNQQQYSSDHLLDIPVPQHYEHLSRHQTQPLNEPVQQQYSDTQQQYSYTQQQQQQQQQQSQYPQSNRPNKIYPILRSPIVIRIKPLSTSTTSTTSSHKSLKRRRQSSRIDPLKSHLSTPRVLQFGLTSSHQQNKKHKFVKVAYSVESSNRSRIKLAPNSRKKYIN